MSDYEYFMLYELDDEGYKVKLDGTEAQFRENNGALFLNPEQVLIIVKEDIRRIFIWKGAKSPVRRRFISSRIASQLQEELVKDAAFHRCKIVSVDQGDEPNEFLKAFHFQSMAVTEKMADMRYIRNIEREKMYDAGITPEEGPKFVKVETKKEVSVSPNTLQTSRTKRLPQIPKETVSKPIQPRKTVSKPIQPRLSQELRKELKTEHVSQISNQREQEIKEKILKLDVPKGYKRENLIVGNKLYGAVNKTVEVLGKSIQETNWEIVKKVPDGMIELKDRKIRAYFNANDGIVEAIEILQFDGKKVVKPIPKERHPAKKKPTIKGKPTAKRKPAGKRKPTHKRKPSAKRK